MTGRTRWGRAEERLTDQGTPDRSRLHTIRQAARQTRAAQDADTRQAYTRWRSGLVVPHAITTALDLRDLYGPEVDRACHAAEPEVDQWEAGELYPRWDQLVALACLTGVPVRRFTLASEPVPPWRTSLWFHMSDPERRHIERTWNPIMRFPRAVLAEAALDQTSTTPPDE